MRGGIPPAHREGAKAVNTPNLAPSFHVPYHPPLANPAHSGWHGGLAWEAVSTVYRCSLQTTTSWGTKQGGERRRVSLEGQARGSGPQSSTRSHAETALEQGPHTRAHKPS